jgi:hypothetical protein
MAAPEWLVKEIVADLEKERAVKKDFDEELRLLIEKCLDRLNAETEVGAETACSCIYYSLKGAATTIKGILDREQHKRNKRLHGKDYGKYEEWDDNA